MTVWCDVHQAISMRQLLCAPQVARMPCGVRRRGVTGAFTSFMTVSHTTCLHASLM